jgi:hypothetical protein
MSEDREKENKNTCRSPSGLFSSKSDSNQDDDEGQANVSDQTEMENPQIQLGFIIAQSVQARGDIGRIDPLSEKRIEKAGQLNGCES